MKFSTLSKLHGAWYNQFTLYKQKSTRFLLLPKHYIDRIKSKFILHPNFHLSCALINKPLSINDLPEIENSEYIFFTAKPYFVHPFSYRLTVPQKIIKLLKDKNITLNKNIFLITSTNEPINFTSIILGEDEDETS